MRQSVLWSGSSKSSGVACTRPGWQAATAPCRYLQLQHQPAVWQPRFVVLAQAQAEPQLHTTDSETSPSAADLQQEAGALLSHQQQQQQQQDDAVLSGTGDAGSDHAMAAAQGAQQPQASADHPQLSADAATASAAAEPADPDAATSTDSSSSSSGGGEAELDPSKRFTYFYTSNVAPIKQPALVQLPPPGADNSETVRPYFATAKYRPPTFLQYYPAPPNTRYNIMSFLGEYDPHRGKYLALGARLDAFLTSYFNTVGRANRRMFLAESYQESPFKFYQELDFPWDLDPQLVLQLIPKVVDIVAQEVVRVYADQVPQGANLQPVVSMRTVFKVHLNFPGITTMEAKAGVVRKAVINRCRAELSGQPPLDKLRVELALQEHLQEAQTVLLQLQQLVQQQQQAGQEIPPDAMQLLDEHRQLLQSATTPSSSQPLGSAQQPQAQDQQQEQQQDQQQGQQQQQEQQQPQQLSLEEQQAQLDWESILDFPHGSLRLLGSCKAPWMDSDPAWVTEKAYSRVEWVGGQWLRQPLSLASILECSILLEEGELRVFEQTEEFLEVTYQGAQKREEVLTAKRAKRAAKRMLDIVQFKQHSPEEPMPKSKVALKAQRSREKRQRRLELQQQAAQEAAAKAEQERRRAEALARLQQVSATAAALQRPALSRPLQRPQPPPPVAPPAAPPTTRPPA